MFVIREITPIENVILESILEYAKCSLNLVVSDSGMFFFFKVYLPKITMILVYFEEIPLGRLFDFDLDN